MYLSEKDVNNQIKQKILLFQEIDKATKAVAYSEKIKTTQFKNQDFNKIPSKVNFEFENFEKANQSNISNTKFSNNNEEVQTDINKNKLKSEENHFYPNNANLLNTKDTKYSNFEINNKNETENLKISKDFSNEHDSKKANKFLTNFNNNKKVNYENFNKGQNINDSKSNKKKTDKDSLSQRKVKEKNIRKEDDHTSIKQINSYKEIKENQSKNCLSPLKSILKKSSKEKQLNSSMKNSYGERFIPFEDSNKTDSEFAKKNKKIIFNDISNKITPNNFISNFNGGDNLNYQNANNDQINNTYKSAKNNFDIKKDDFKNFFSNPHYDSPIRMRKSPSFSSSFLHEGDGMMNIFLNKDKNLSIVNLDKLYQGSFTKEFYELYSKNQINDNTNNNASTINKTNQNTPINKIDYKTTSNFDSYINLKNSSLGLNGNNVIIYNKYNRIADSNASNKNIVSIQSLNKFKTKQNNKHNLNIFSIKKKEDLKSKENKSSNTLEKILSQSSEKINFNVKKNPSVENILLNRKEYETNKMQLASNKLQIQKQENDKSNTNFTLNNEEGLEEYGTEIDNFNQIINENKLGNNSNNEELYPNFCNYAEYNYPVKNGKNSEKLYVEKLSNYHLIYKRKLEKIRQDEYEKRCKTASPQITKKAQSIVREGHLFHCRLYPYHKIPKETFVRNMNNSIRNTYYNHNNIDLNSDNLIYYNSKNNCNSASFVIDNLRRLEGIEDINTYKIYRTYKGKDYNFDIPVNNNSGLKKKKNRNSIDKSLNDLSRKQSFSNFMDRSHSLIPPNILNKSYNCPSAYENANDPFSFKPNLNINSLNIALKLSPSFLRLTSKSKKKKKSINEKFKNSNSISNKTTNLSNEGILSLQHLRMVKSRSKSKGEFNRTFELYRRGVQRLKKKVELHIQKIIDEEESYKQFPFKPKINQNILALNLCPKINYKKESTINADNDQYNSDNIKNHLKKNQNPEKLDGFSSNSDNSIKNKTNSRNEKNAKSSNTSKIQNVHKPNNYYNKFIPEGFFSNLSNSNISNNNANMIIKNNSISFYDKNVYWKKNLEKKFDKMKDVSEEIYKNIHTFKPDVLKTQLAPDEKFIEKNIKHIQDYVNKRRTFLRKTHEEQNFLKSKYQFAENSKIKTTIPKEFNLSYKASQEKILSKSALGFYRANEKDEKTRDLERENNINKKSIDDLSFLNKNYSKRDKKNSKKMDLVNLRNNFKINEFFEFDEEMSASNEIENNEKNKNENFLNKNNNDLVYNKNSLDFKRTAATLFDKKGFNTIKKLNKTCSNFKTSDGKAAILQGDPEFNNFDKINDKKLLEPNHIENINPIYQNEHTLHEEINEGDFINNSNQKIKNEIYNSDKLNENYYNDNTAVYGNSSSFINNAYEDFDLASVVINPNLKHNTNTHRI